jgi:hypothetical protein
MSDKRKLTLGLLFAVCTMLGTALAGGATPLAATAIPECSWETCFGARTCMFSQAATKCLQEGGPGEAKSCTVTFCY